MLTATTDVSMRSTDITARPRRDQNESRPAPPFQWLSGRSLAAIFGTSLLGGFFSLLVVGAIKILLKVEHPWLAPVAFVVGLALGAVLSIWTVRAMIGRGIRSDPGALPGRRLQPGTGLSNHIMALREGLTTAPPRRVSSISAHLGPVNALAIAPDRRSVLTASQRFVRLWDLASGFEIRSFASPDFISTVRAVSFSPDGRLAAACGGEHTDSENHPTGGFALIWDVESGRELRRFVAEGSLSAMAFTADGRSLLLGGTDFLRLWDLESADLVALIAISTGFLEREEVLSVAISPDGRLAMCGCRESQEARLFRLESGECLRRFTGHKTWLRLIRPAAVTCVAFSPDGRRVLTGSYDQTARLWGVKSGEPATVFRGHCGHWGWRGVVAACWLPDGKRAITASEDGTLRLWDVDTAEELKRFDHGAQVRSLAVSRDGRLALSGGKDGVVRVWDVPRAD